MLTFANISDTIESHKITHMSHGEAYNFRVLPNAAYLETYYYSVDAGEDSAVNSIYIECRTVYRGVLRCA